MKKISLLILLICAMALCFYIHISCDEDEPDIPLQPTPTPSVLEWFDSMSGYPRLIGTEEMLLAAKDKADDPDYTVLYDRLVSTCNQTAKILDMDDFYPPNGYYNGNIAKSCALLYWITDDEAYAEKTASILLNAYDGYETNLTDATTDDVHGSSNIIGNIQAFDLMMGTDFLTSEEANTIQEKLESQVQAYYEYYVESFPVYHTLAFNNHNIIHASAVGVGALMFPEHEQARDWLNYALTEIDFFMTYLTNGLGGWGEGYYYEHYSALHYLPFIIPYSRLSSGNSTWIEQNCAHIDLEEYCFNGQYALIEDFVSREEIQKLWEMQYKIRMPNGVKPPLEDGFFHAWFGGIISGILNDPYQLWDWKNNFSDTARFNHASSWTLDLTADSFVLYDDTVAPKQPEDGPCYCIPENGFAVMRSGWEQNDIFLMFNAEYGLMRCAGHEQVDDLSFQIFAYRDYLAIDSGYIKWDLRGLVAGAENHNIILIDDNGPPDSPVLPPPLVSDIWGAYITYWEDNEDIVVVSGAANYEDTDVKRNIMFPHREYFIIEDRLSSSEEHDYKWQLHGNAGGDSNGTFNLLSSGAEWIRPDGTSLNLWISTTEGDAALSNHTDVHGWNYNQQDMHEIMVANTNNDIVNFLSVIIPLDTGGSADVQKLDTGYDSVAAWIIQPDGADYRDLVISREQQEIGTVFNLASSGFKDGIVFDGTLLFISLDKNNSDNLFFSFCFGDDDFQW